MKKLLEEGVDQALLYNTQLALSAAISLKRLADAAERLASTVEEREGRLPWIRTA